MSYITDLTHLLNSKGALATTKGAGFAMADFQTKIIYHATLRENIKPTYKCFNCKASNASYNVQDDGSVAWVCNECGINGFIRNWRGSLWDMTNQVSANN